MKGGSASAVIRNQALAKHAAVTNSLSAVHNAEIKGLDIEVKVKDGSLKTLREVIIADISYPLITEGIEPKSIKQLFFGVDMCTTGPEKRHVYYLLAYKDRERLATSLSEILPAYCKHFYGEESLKKWFHVQAQSAVDDVTLEFQEGKWTGKWSTEDDDLLQALADEDMGIQIDNLEILKDSRTEAPFVATADDLSYKSFKTAAGNDDTQRREEVIPVGQAAAEPAGADVGSGET